MYSTEVACGAAQPATSQSFIVVDKVEESLQSIVFKSSMRPSSGVEASGQPIVVEESLQPSVSAAPTLAEKQMQLIECKLEIAQRELKAANLKIEAAMEHLNAAKEEQQAAKKMGAYYEEKLRKLKCKK